MISSDCWKVLRDNLCSCVGVKQREYEMKVVFIGSNSVMYREKVLKQEDDKSKDESIKLVL